MEDNMSEDKCESIHLTTALSQTLQIWDTVWNYKLQQGPFAEVSTVRGMSFFKQHFTEISFTHMFLLRTRFSAIHQ